MRQPLGPSLGLMTCGHSKLMSTISRTYKFAACMATWGIGLGTCCGMEKPIYLDILNVNLFSRLWEAEVCIQGPRLPKYEYSEYQSNPFMSKPKVIWNHRAKDCSQGNAVQVIAEALSLPGSIGSTLIIFVQIAISNFHNLLEAGWRRQQLLTRGIRLGCHKESPEYDVDKEKIMTLQKSYGRRTIKVQDDKF
ncbi:hypothetical protein VNO77_26731 [Canavalia gladiata]|uniref:Uncharacterized protein n=1 Tax=Canavalia gladiata TaxID=3824 RepID=A0AAN9KU34_CANGL